MRNHNRRNYLIVLDRFNKSVEAVIAGVDEKNKRSGYLTLADTALLEREYELRTRHLAGYDIFIVRAKGLKELKQSFSNFSGWDQVQVEQIVV